MKGAPPELYANVLLTAGPAGKGSLVVVQLCFVGTQQKGKEYLHAIESWNGEKSLLNEVSEKSFLAQQDSVAQILRGQRMWLIFIISNFSKTYYFIIWETMVYPFSFDHFFTR